jgi:hypothetical protein
MWARPPSLLDLHKVEREWINGLGRRLVREIQRSCFEERTTGPSLFIDAGQLDVDVPGLGPSRRQGFGSRDLTGLVTR